MYIDMFYLLTRGSIAPAAGFEPAWAEPSGSRGHRLTGLGYAGTIIFL